MKQVPTWRRIDLHLHTPGSSDYQEPRASYLDILQKAEARGLDIIAFTDHNSVAGYAALRRDIDQLEFLEINNRLLPEESRRLNEYRRLLSRILVLPGFEFTATFGFHILSIFPPETSVRKLEHTLLELSIPEEKLDLGSSEVGATTDVLNAYGIIADAGGLVIGAHVNSTHGIAMIGLGFGGQTKIAYTQDPNLHALEVTDLESTSRRATSRFFNGSKPEYPRRMHCIQGSDAHRLTRDPLRPEKNLGIGDRCTEVLLPEVSFEALKALFASTDFSRSRPYRAPEQHPFDPLTSARAEGATIVQAFNDMPGSPQVRVQAVLRDLVAFANTNGGTMYIGASPNAQEPIHGVEGAAELAELIKEEAARQIAPPLTPDIETLSSEDKAVLVVTVPKGTETPYALEPGYIYVRQESETALALRDEIVQLVRAALAPATIGFDPRNALPPRPIARSVPEPAPRDETRGEVVVPVVDAPPAAPVDLPAPSVVPAPGIAQQVAVQQATAAEQERQQDRTPVPRTGVEIIASTERNGVIFHTVRDLRNRRVVRNVTRESARRLWRYAILQVEEHQLLPEDVTWDTTDQRRGYWKGYRQPEGMRRYNLVYREPQPQRNEGDPAERLRVFYGVTEDGIDDRWRAVLPSDSVVLEIYYDETPPLAEAVVREQELSQVEELAVPLAQPEPLDESPFAPIAESVVPIGVATAVPELDITASEAVWPSPEPTTQPEPEPTFTPSVAESEMATLESAAPALPARGRGRTSRRRATAPVAEPAAAPTPVAEPAPEVVVTTEVAAVAPEPIAVVEVVAETPAPTTKSKRAPRRRKAAPAAAPDAPVEAVEQVSATEPVAQPSPEPPALPETLAPAEPPTPTPSRRRRAPRKAAPAAPQESE